MQMRKMNLPKSASAAMRKLTEGEEAYARTAPERPCACENAARYAMEA
jgi:hypothetical protein